MPDGSSAVFEGAVSVRAVLDTRSRPLRRVFVTRDAMARHARLLDQARRRGVPVRVLPRAELDGMAGGRTHGGIVATVGRRRPTPLSALTVRTRPFLALLDGVADPYQFGQSVRALYAAGAHGLVVPARRPIPVAPWRGPDPADGFDTIVARASAGAAVVDDWVRLPYGRGFAAALDTTGATAALAFEVARQRRATRATDTR